MTTSTDSNFYCQYRLPCGYCKELGRDCIKMPCSNTYFSGTITNHPDTAIVATSAYNCNSTNEIQG